PRLPPALYVAVSIDVPSYPCSANSRVATSTTCARVARPRSTFLFIRSPAFIGPTAASSALNRIDRPTVGLQELDRRSAYTATVPRRPSNEGETMTSEMERLDKYRSQVRTRSGPASYVDTGGPGRPVL